jgi:hypothetical protein
LQGIVDQDSRTRTGIYATAEVALSLQPQNLQWQLARRGTIGRAGGGYYQCANWLWRVLAGVIDYGPVVLLAYFQDKISARITDQQSWRLSVVGRLGLVVRRLPGGTSLTPRPSSAWRTK